MWLKQVTDAKHPPYRPYPVGPTSQPLTSNTLFARVGQRRHDADRWTRPDFSFVATGSGRVAQRVWLSGSAKHHMTAPFADG
jgi:hypothetical protein